jgi:type II secretion system protein G
MKRGFTLIELLVVIAIIGLLSSVVLASLSTARTKARNIKRVADFKSVSTAMELYRNDHGDYPPYEHDGAGSSYQGHRNAFTNMTQTLVDESLLSSVPLDPGGSTYMYYNYGAGNAPGAIITVPLEGIAPTTEPPFGSCRPFDNNWCSSTQASTYYCLCHPY